MAVKKDSKYKGGELGVIGATLGILSIILIGSNGIFIAVVGLILSMIQHKRYPTKFSKVGIILNIIGLILAVILIILLVTWLGPLIEAEMGNLGNFPVQ